jgi:hypothetical protein
MLHQHMTSAEWNTGFTFRWCSGVPKTETYHAQGECQTTSKLMKLKAL